MRRIKVFVGKSLLFLLALVIITSGYYGLTSYSQNQLYERAEAAMVGKDYAAARQYLEALPDAEQKETKLRALTQLEYQELKATGDYQAAMDFYDLHEWTKNDEYRELQYLHAKKILSTNRTLGMSLLADMGDYRDAKELLQKTAYQYGLEMQVLGYDYSAQQMFAMAGDYQDAKQQKRVASYDLAQRLYQNEQFVASQSFFEAAEGYEDAKEYLAKIERLSHYQKCIALAKEGRYAEAKALAETMPEQYQDRDALLKLFEQASQVEIEGTWHSVKLNTLDLPIYELQISSKIEGLQLLYQCDFSYRDNTGTIARPNTTYHGILQDNNTVLLSRMQYEKGVRSYQLRLDEDGVLHLEDVIVLETGEESENEENLWLFER